MTQPGYCLSFPPSRLASEGPNAVGIDAPFSVVRMLVQPCHVADKVVAAFKSGLQEYVVKARDKQDMCASAGAPGESPRWGRAVVATGCHQLMLNDTNDRMLWTMVGNKKVIPISTEAAYKKGSGPSKPSDSFERVRAD